MEKKLYRSRNKKVIAGIAGGLGDYIGVDPVIIRIILILITIINGIGILIYIIMWIVIQEEPGKNTAKNNPGVDTGGSKSEETLGSNIDNPQNIVTPESSTKGRVVFGAILIGIGLMFLFEKFIPSFDFEVLFSVGVILLGIFLIFNSFNKSEKEK